MRSGRSRSSAVALAAFLALAGAAGQAGPSGPAGGALAAGGTPPSTSRAASHPPADASALYNAGTVALGRNDAGPAVAFLLAARRLDPRAADIRRNLSIAETRAAFARGADASAAGSVPPPVSAREAWWLSAVLLAAGALLASWWRLGRAPRAAPHRRRAMFVAGHTALAAGLALAALLALQTREEAAHPEAVVVVPSLAAGPAPDERPRPPYLLGAGEIVRLGRVRGALVELRVSGTPIGWAERAGVWRVGDAARYTAGFGGS